MIGPSETADNKQVPGATFQANDSHRPTDLPGPQLLPPHQVSFHLQNHIKEMSYQGSTFAAHQSKLLCRICRSFLGAIKAKAQR